MHQAQAQTQLAASVLHAADLALRAACARRIQAAPPSDRATLGAQLTAAKARVLAFLRGDTVPMQSMPAVPAVSAPQQAWAVWADVALLTSSSHGD